MGIAVENLVVGLVFHSGKFLVVAMACYSAVGLAEGPVLVPVVRSSDDSVYSE